MLGNRKKCVKVRSRNGVNCVNEQFYYVNERPPFAFIFPRKTEYVSSDDVTFKLLHFSSDILIAYLSIWGFVACVCVQGERTNQTRNCS